MLVLLVLALVAAVLGLLTVAKWLFIVAAVLAVLWVVSSFSGGGMWGRGP